MKTRPASEALAPGLHYSLPMADYVADPCAAPSLSSSTIKALMMSALKAKQGHPRLGGEPDFSTVADIGSAAHGFVLEGKDKVKVVAKVTKADGEEIVPTTWATKDAKAEREKIRAEGKIPLLMHDAEKVYAMAKLAGEAIADHAGPGDPEVTVIWQEGDIWCRARADWLPHDQDRPVIDYKTTGGSAEPDEWIRRFLFSGGYDIEAAWYLRGLRAVGREHPEHRYLVQEQEEPYDYCWVGLGAGCEIVRDATKWIERAIKIWARCLRTGKFPGYRKDVHYPEQAAWRALRIEELLLAAEEV